ncbi:MAG: hypothetical protein ABSC47_02710, partial [Terracidiphilus sp.]
SGAWAQQSAPPASDQKRVAVIKQQAANGDGVSFSSKIPLTSGQNCFITLASKRKIVSSFVSDSAQRCVINSLLKPRNRLANFFTSISLEETMSAFRALPD